MITDTRRYVVVKYQARYPSVADTFSVVVRETNEHISHHESEYAAEKALTALLVFDHIHR